MAFQVAEWVAEGIGYLAMLAVVALAFTGVFGKDADSRKSVAAEGGKFWVEFEQPVRWQTRTTLEVHAVPGADNRAGISINDTYLKDMVIERITPEPERVEVASDRTTFIFAGGDQARTLVVRFHLEPETPGVKEARISLGESQRVRYRQIVLP